MKTVAVIRHVHFEDLGTFEEPLAKAGYEIQYYDIGRRELPDPAAPDLLIVLGAPVSVYEDDKYPFLRDELALLKACFAGDVISVQGLISKIIEFFVSVTVQNASREVVAFAPPASEALN
jgi:hypothetical protein